MRKIDSLLNIFSKLSNIEITVNIVVGICIIALFISVFINFIESNDRKDVKREKKSIVETGTMTAFFVIFYLLIRLRIGQFMINSFHIYFTIIIIGLCIIVFGCIFNIIGRFNLGKNWGNQIKIYDGHTLVKNGVYSIVRHPLYASIIWMFTGASIIYLNWSSFLANILIFIPFMYYRAKQEEEMLSKQFTEYKKYKDKVGMFFPRIIRGSNNESM